MRPSPTAELFRGMPLTSQRPDQGCSFHETSRVFPVRCLRCCSLCGHFASGAARCSAKCASSKRARTTKALQACAYRGPCWQDQLSRDHRVLLVQLPHCNSFEPVLDAWIKAAPGPRRPSRASGVQRQLRAQQSCTTRWKAWASSTLCTKGVPRHPRGKLKLARTTTFLPGWATRAWMWPSSGGLQAPSP